MAPASERDDFSAKSKETLARRVSFICSNPGCQMLTVGPNSDPDKSTNIGVAAHITAAAQGGPRFDPTIQPHERSSINNAVWLCQSCAKLIDSDTDKYSVDVLRGWKQGAEENAGMALNRQMAKFAQEQLDPGVEIIKPNGYFERQLDGFKMKYFLQNGNLHVEQELTNGSVGYYVIDQHGNMLEQQFPYPLSEYTVQVEPDLVLGHHIVDLPDGGKKEHIRMKWGKRAELTWDAEHKLVDLQVQNGVRMDNLQKIFVFESPNFSEKK